MQAGPLAGVRVIDLTDDTGRFATKVLAECGASVLRVRGGSRGPSMREPECFARGGLFDWWYDGGKQRLELDLDVEEDRRTYRRLAERADLIVDTEPPGRLAALGIDHSDVAIGQPALVQVSLTAFGRTGPRAGWQTTDLVAAALGGVLSISGLPDEPVVPWGRQAFNFGGFMAAVCGLAGLRAARTSGVGQHVDLSLHEVVTTTVEQLFFQYWFDDLLRYPKIAVRQGSLHWIGAYQIVAAKSGWLMITPTPNALGLFTLMQEQGFSGIEDLMAKPPEERFRDVPSVMQRIAEFATTNDAATLFREAQDRHVAFGEVQSVAQVAANPQHAFREFFRAVDWAGPEVWIPGPVARFDATPAAAPVPPPAHGSSVEDVLADWAARPAAPASATPAAAVDKPLTGVRVLDLTHVLAGPFANRMLGDLGADILKVQTADRATTVNDPSHPYFYAWNRSKRDIALNMKDERAVGVLRKLIEQSDVLMENFSAGVLDRWGVSYDTAKSWNPAIIYVTMSGCGHEGPWSSLVTYAPTIHALSGLTSLSNPPGRGDVGPGFSLNDHAAGFSGALAVLAALEARRNTGEGQHVDIAQLETGAYLIGPALIEYLTNAREFEANGNADPFEQLAPNECYRTADGEFVAISCRDDDDWARLVTATGVDNPPSHSTVAGRIANLSDVDASIAAWAADVTADAAQELLQAAGVPAGKVQNVADLMADPQHVARGLWRAGDHAVFGGRPYDRFPGVWSGTDLEPYLLSPAYVGEHNFEVYAEVGLDPEFIAEAIGDGLFT
jgi:crotonobetainyl-CoA:carnitine CoA-transferase CaiB-like acyl-CoA transferase